MAHGTADEVAHGTADEVAIGRRVDEILRPYVCPLAVEWLATTPELRYRSVDGTLVFADVSGFTRLTERLAKRGRSGAEEISDLLDHVLAALLDAASAQGGWLVKWGGDALLLMFDGEGHAPRAAAASYDMRAVIARVGRLDTSVGHIRLKMSVAAATGEVDFILAGRRHRELVITGATSTLTAQLEGDASAGQVLVAPSTAALLPVRCLGEPVGGGILLARRPPVNAPPPAPDAGIDDPVGLERAMDPAVAEAVLAGAGDGEHRGLAVSFIEFRGVADLLASRGTAAVVDAVDRLMTVCQDAAARFGVTFHETDIGPDGGKILLVAGAPVALDAPEEALLCTVRETVERYDGLRLRAGVTTGRVFSGGLGPAYRRSYSVKGDMVNLGARIMGKAEPGQVLALPEVLAASPTPFETTRRDPFMVKGKARPVEALIVGPARRRGSDGDGDARRSLPLCGRTAELRAIRQALEQSEGGVGTFIEVTAGPGGGKTRLLAELGQGRTGLLRVAGEPFQATTPYHVLGALLAQALGLGEDPDPDIRAARLRAWSAAVAPELEEWLPLLGTAVGTTLPDTPATAALDEQYRAARLHDVVLGALDAALPVATAIVIDDAQHCDEASFATIRRVVAGLADRPWVLVLAHRPWERDPVAADAPHLRRVTLDLAPLDPQAAVELIHHEAEATPLARHVVAAIVARAGGQPLFLRELVRAAQSGSPDLPDSVERVLASRIDRLSPPDRGILRACAVQGSVADPELTERLTGSGPLRAGDWARLAAFVTPGPHGLTFLDPLAREVAYEGLPFRLRAQLHSRLADELSDRAEAGGVDQAVLGEHYYRASRFEPALQHATAGARAAADRYAYVEAATGYERAVASARRLTGADRDEVAVLWYELGETRRKLGEYAAAEGAYAAARRLSTDPLARARSTERWALSAGWRGAYALGRQRVRRGLAGLESLPDQPGDAPESSTMAEVRDDLVLRRAYLDFQQGHHERARRSAAEVADNPGAGLRQQAFSLQLMDAAGSTLGDDSDGRYAEASLAAYRQLGDGLAEGRLLLQLGARAYFAGRWVEAITRYQEAEAAYARAGDTAKVTLVSSNIAEVQVEQWHLAEAEARLREVLRDWQAAGADNLVGFAQLLLGRTLVRRSRFEEGVTLLTAARDGFAAQGSRADVVDADAYLAEAAALEGHLTEALSLARVTLRRASGLSGTPVQAPLLWRLIGRCLDDQGDVTGAGQAYDRALASGRARSARHDVAFALAALAAHRHREGLAPDEGADQEARSLAADLGLAVELSMAAGLGPAVGGSPDDDTVAAAS